MAACRPIEQLYQTYRDRATFLLVYIQESHPGMILSVPTKSGGKELRVIPLITSETESLDNLRKLVQLGELTVPAGIESPANSVNRDYAAYPNRIYVVDVNGRVVFKGAPGPTGFKVPELADWLRANVR
jgi:type I thyroxine 5'-deiodinase